MSGRYRAPTTTAQRGAELRGAQYTVLAQPIRRHPVFAGTGRKGGASAKVAGLSVAANRMSSGLYSSLRKGSVAELEALVSTSLASSVTAGTAQRYADNWRTLETFCELRKLPCIGPVVFTTFCLFAAWWVFVRGNAAHTLGGMLASFRSYSLLRFGTAGKWTDDEEEQGRRMRAGLQKLAPSEVRHKTPLRFLQLRDMGRQLGQLPGLIGPPSAVQKDEAAMYFLIFLLLHQGMMRAGEIALLLVRDITFLRADGVVATSLDDVCGVQIEIYGSKTGHRTDKPQVVFIAKRSDEFDALRRLAGYLRRHGLTDPWRRNEAVFCKLNAQGSRTEARVGRSDISAYARRILRDAGYPATEAEGYTGHTFRAGGATDAIASGMPLPLVIQQGRWKSDAWKVYQRPSADVVHQWATWAPVTSVKSVVLSSLS